MKNIFKDIILERQIEDLGVYLPRQCAIPQLPNKALAIIGIRRCGKTTLLRQIWDDFKKSKYVNSTQLVYVNFFDERLFDLKASQLGTLLEAQEELMPRHASDSMTYFFLDEVQVVKGWEMFVDRLIRSKNRRIYITGSSSSLLSKEVSTAMRGRSTSLELFPFNFLEVLKADRIDVQPFGTKGRSLIVKRFNDYLIQGGFPETLHVTPSMRRLLLQEYVNVVLLKDIIERHHPTDSAGLSYMLRLLMNQIGSLFTVNKTCERLNAAGHKVTKSEVSQFFDWFLDSYLLFSVPIYAQSALRREINPRKIYCIDTGMAYHMSKSHSENIGHLLENLVFLHLRKTTEDIFYYKDSHQKEVDFCVRDQNGDLQLIQVCQSLADENVRQRELDALMSAMKELRAKSGLIITIDQEEEIRVSNKRIKVLPAWKYLIL